MLNSPLLLVFESYSPALAEFVCRQCVARKWATKAYCRHVAVSAKKTTAVKFRQVRRLFEVERLNDL